MRDAHEEEIVEFRHVTTLTVSGSWIDYSKQLLFDRRTRLPSLRTLGINYQQLCVITENFTNDAARVNCTQVQHLRLEGEPTLYPSGIARYFPSCKDKFRLTSD